MRGVPVRLEIGPRDIENNQCVLVRRDNFEKQVASLDGLADTVKEQLDVFAKAIFAKAKANMEQHTVKATSIEEMKAALTERPNFVKAMWCGDEACEIAIKDQTGMPSRCIPVPAKAVSTAKAGKKSAR
jgi:prolyl-tRNA synthetase